MHCTRGIRLLFFGLLSSLYNGIDIQANKLFLWDLNSNFADGHIDCHGIRGGSECECSTDPYSFLKYL